MEDKKSLTFEECYNYLESLYNKFTTFPDIVKDAAKTKLLNLINEKLNTGISINKSYIYKSFRLLCITEINKTKTVQLDDEAEELIASSGKLDDSIREEMLLKQINEYFEKYKKEIKKRLGVSNRILNDLFNYYKNKATQKITKIPIVIPITLKRNIYLVKKFTKLFDYLLKNGELPKEKKRKSKNRKLSEKQLERLKLTFSVPIKDDYYIQYPSSNKKKMILAKLMGVVYHYVISRKNVQKLIKNNKLIGDIYKISISLRNETTSTYLYLDKQIEITLLKGTKQIKKFKSGKELYDHLIKNNLIRFELTEKFETLK